MQLLYGTTNDAKLRHMQSLLAAMDITLVGLQDLHLPIPKVDECGASPLDNARMKALCYYNAFARPVFSCDSGLYLEGLPQNMQPGVHVRRLNGKTLNDQEMTDYYASLAHQNGGELIAQYQNAICFIDDSGRMHTHMDEHICGERFILCDKPHTKSERGFPLDRLSKQIKTGMYYYDMPAIMSDMELSNGFLRFFAKALCQ